MMIQILLKLFAKLNALHAAFIYRTYLKKYNIDPSFRFNGREIWFYGEGQLEILEDSYIGSLSTIQIHKDAKVKIGKGCSISHNVRMYTSSKEPDFDFSHKKSIPDKIGDIIIEDNVWIGANVFINPGVLIGQNSIIGANSVVTKDVVAFGIYGGVPAKLIRMKQINA